MKRAMIAALALSVAAPLAATPAAALTPRGDHDRYDRGDRDQGRYTPRRSSRDNGFYYNGRFHRGNPTAAQMRARDFRWEQRQWRRGERISAYERAHYSRVSQAEYRRYHLRPAPRGYEYRRTNTGEVILVAVATGLILSVLLNN